MAFQDQYFSGQGIVYVADRDSSGNILAYRDVGNVPALRVSLETDVQDHKESRTGKRLTDFRLTTENRARVTMTLEKFTKANLMLLLYGSNQTTTGTTVITNETLNPLVTAVAVGDVYFTKFPNVSVYTVRANVTALTENTDYTIVPATGRINIISIANMGATGTLNINYTAAAYESVVMFKDANKERALRFVGLNTADSERQVLIELYRVIFDPSANLDVINDEIAQFEVEGSVLVDNTRLSDATLGGFGRIIQ